MKAEELNNRLNSLVESSDSEDISDRAIYPLRDEAGDVVEGYFTRAWGVSIDEGVAIDTDQIRYVDGQLEAVPDTQIRHLEIYDNGDISDDNAYWYGSKGQSRLLENAELTVNKIENAARERAMQRL